MTNWCFLIPPKWREIGDWLPETWRKVQAKKRVKRLQGQEGVAGEVWKLQAKGGRIQAVMK